MVRSLLAVSLALTQLRQQLLASWGRVVLAGLAAWLAGCAAGPPRTLSSATFAGLVKSMSEPPGSFAAENLVSNEDGYPRVLASLEKHQGGAYLGVGPDQNLSYIARTRPSMAFILDVRRDNLLEHLLFKALFALSGNRGEFLSLLLSRPVPANLPFPALVEALERAPGQEQAYDGNLARVLGKAQSFGVDLKPADLDSLRRIYRTFFAQGLGLRYESPLTSLSYPPFRDLLEAREPGGSWAHFLARDQDFAFVRELESRNLVIPVVGDFAGPHALGAIAEYLRQHDLRVSAFYLSNVEYYLPPDRMKAFVDNLARLPADPGSVLIRSYLNESENGPPRPPHPLRQGRELFTCTLQPLTEFVERYRAGRYRTYGEVVLGASGSTSTQVMPSSPSPSFSGQDPASMARP